MRRIDEPELLDEHDAQRGDVERSLRDLQRINRFLGGIRTYRKLLARAAPDRAAPLREADLGAGTADCLEALAHYPKLTPVALDFNTIQLHYRRHPSPVQRAVAAPRALPRTAGA